VVRKDFCGWSALGPISLFLENIIGIRSADAFEKRLVWDIPANIPGRIGVYAYQFGDVTADLFYEEGVLSVETDEQFTLIVNGREYSLDAGSNRFIIREQL
jgi:hypothetical protein